MTFDKIDAFLQAHVDRFLSGDVSDLSDIRTYPFSVFVEGEYRIELTPADSERHIHIRRKIFREKNAAKIRSNLLTLERRSDGRMLASARLDLFDTDWQLVGSGLAHYLIRIEPPNGIRIESCEIIRRILPTHTEAKASARLH